MFTSLSQGVGRMLVVLTIPLLTSTAHAQWGSFGNPCNTCSQSAAIAAPQYAAAPIAYNPCMQQVSVATACPCMQPVTETVYRDVQVTQMVPEKRMVKKPVLRTVYEDRPVTAYKQEMETRVAEVPTVSYQTVQECQAMTVDRSHWQTVYQPVQKISPCQYDPRPGIAGMFNRTSYNMRMAFTPNQIRQRQFVPNVQTVSVPVNRTVSIPGTRQVSYNVAKLVPYETTERVARVVTDYEEVEVTAYVPQTVTKTVAVGNSIRYAFVDPYGGATTATALSPTPDKRSAEQTIPKKTASGKVELNSYEAPLPHPAIELNQAPAQDTYSPFGTSEPEQSPAEPRLFQEQGNNRTSAITQSQVAGWRASRRSAVTVARPTNGPSLPTVAAN